MKWVQGKAWITQNLWISTIPVTTSLILIGQYLGLFQFLDLQLVDQFFRLRQPKIKTHKIIVVTIDDSDISKLKQWPLSDQNLFKALTTISQQEPAVIGIDLYRNLLEPPGSDRLKQFFRNTPNVFGVEKVIGEPVAAHPTLAELNQVGMADVVIDSDSKVRRALLSIQTEDHQLKYGLATQIALYYLNQKEITLQQGKHSAEVKLGQATYTQLSNHSGGYVNTDLGGYQILISDWRKPSQFDTISLSKVLEGQIEAKLFKDRIVYLGTIAKRSKDSFYTPIQGPESLNFRTPGVFIHATISNQIISGAVNGDSLLTAVSYQYYWIWIVGCSSLGAIVCYWSLNHFQRNTVIPSLLWAGSYPILCISLSFISFLGGWWLPTAGAVAAGLTSTMSVIFIQHNQWKKKASCDGLTQLVNRSFFDQYLAQRMLERQSLALLLCDVDCFKQFNDSYGHQAGDDCLKAVANALKTSVRKGDLVARYGGEEFVIVFPDTDLTTAIHISERVRSQVEYLQIPHQASQVAPHITISGGLAFVSTAKGQPQDLIEAADQLLYRSKNRGRNQISFEPK